MARHIASGDAEQPAKRKHQVRVVLADAVSRDESLGCRCVHTGPVKAIAHAPIHPGADGAGQVGSRLAAVRKLGGHGAQRDVRPGESRWQ